MSLSLLAAESRQAQPWKNGGGLTWTLASAPEGAELDHLDWRLSLALVERAGPFSHFAGLDRLTLVLDGELELEVDGRPLILDEASPAAAFAGEAMVAARAPAAPVADINLLVRRGAFAGVLERRRFETRAAIVGQDITFVMSRLGGVEAALAGERLALGAGDALRVDHARGGLLRLVLAEPDELIIAHVNAVRA
jgi:hypothetical protein